MKVFNIIGTSGSGKTTVLDLLRIEELKPIKLHSMVRPSNYFNLDFTLISAKWNYISNWYNSIISCQKDGLKTIISDRCPIEVCGYALKGELLLQALIEANRELEEHLGIEMIHIYLYSDTSMAFQRLEERKEIRDDSHYDHHSTEALERTVAFYEEHKDLWHYHIKNENLDETVKKVKQIIIDETNKQAKS